MTAKWMGAILVVAGCGGFGFSMAASHRHLEAVFRQYLKALELMQLELSCRLTPLPQLCRMAGETVTGPVGQLLRRLGEELEKQVFSDVTLCVRQAVEAVPGLPAEFQEQISLLGESLGRFDLPGQLRGLQSAAEQAKRILSELEANRTSRLRSYQTLGLCAGAALAILFL